MSESGLRLQTLPGWRVHRRRGSSPNRPTARPQTTCSLPSLAGTLNEVSLGFSKRGTAMCDVCGKVLDEQDQDTGIFTCGHLPGTTVGMDAKAIRAQKGRGVESGVATFTVEDADVSELSAIYSGALPGAAFRKTVRMARRNQLSGPDLNQAIHAYAYLLGADPDILVPGPKSRLLPDPENRGVPMSPNPTYAELVAFAQATGQTGVPMEQLMGAYQAMASRVNAVPQVPQQFAANPADPFAQYGLAAPTPAPSPQVVPATPFPNPFQNAPANPQPAFAQQPGVYAFAPAHAPQANPAITVQGLGLADISAPLRPLGPQYALSQQASLNQGYPSQPAQGRGEPRPTNWRRCNSSSSS